MMYVAKVDNTKEWTIQEYEKLEEGLLAQLIEGELIMSPAPAPNLVHGRSPSDCGVS